MPANKSLAETSYEAKHDGVEQNHNVRVPSVSAPPEGSYPETRSCVPETGICSGPANRPRVGVVGLVTVRTRRAGCEYKHNKASEGQDKADVIFVDAAELAEGGEFVFHGEHPLVFKPGRVITID